MIHHAKIAFILLIIFFSHAAYSDDQALAEKTTSNAEAKAFVEHDEKSLLSKAAGLIPKFGFSDDTVSFHILRKNRENILIRLTNLQDQYNYLLDQEKKNNSLIDKTYIDVNYLKSEIQDIDSKVEQLIARKIELDKNPPTADQLKTYRKNSYDSYKNFTDILTSIDKADVTEEIRRLTSEKNRNLSDINSYETLIKTKLDLTKKLLKKKEELNDIENELYSIDREIDNRLNIELSRNNFRTLISVLFCLLVAAVIIGFFRVALKKDEIATKVFSGENGIKFVTLFLIIIAIILFGIMGILESKELSALLGGLSGFILGRSTNK
jgi:hypothetical protein